MKRYVRRRKEISMVMEDKSFEKDGKLWIEKGADGLCASFQTPIKKSKVLQEVSEKQIDLADKVASENEKFVRIEEGLHLSQMIEKTAAYKHKLETLQREMKELTQRSKQMKIRAQKLQEAKQKEAMKREYQRQKEVEKEELLTAKPAKSNAEDLTGQRL